MMTIGNTPLLHLDCDTGLKYLQDETYRQQ